MKFELAEISAEEYDNLDTCQKLIVMPNARRFGTFRFHSNIYGISWQGDTIIPVIKVIKKFDLVAIGIDNRAIALDKFGYIKFSLGLAGNFLFFIEVTLGFTIVTDNSIVEINGIDCSIGLFEVLPDIITNCEIEGDHYIVTGLDGLYRIKRQ